MQLNDGSEYGVYQQDVQEWEKLYPAVDVMQQLRNMRGWLDSNPKRRKTKAGIRRFVVNWLSKAQDSGGKLAARPTPNRGPNAPASFDLDAYDRMTQVMPGAKQGGQS